MATHFASPDSTRASQSIHGKMPLRPQEDIGSVLERFHKWAGHQQEPVRELTYEEAVARSRRRVYVDDEPVRPEPAKAAASPAPVAPPPPIPFPLVDEPTPVQAPAKPSGPSPAKASKTGKKKVSGDKPVGKAKGEPAATKSKGTKAASSTKARPAKKTSARTKNTTGAKPRPAQKKSAKRAAPKTKTAVASAYAEVQKAAREPEPSPASHATFEQVLAAQIQPPALEPASRPAPAAVDAAVTPVSRAALAEVPLKMTAIAPLPDDVPAVHLTVRMASDERETVRERARDLGITPSAYVRQCALEIDSLRMAFENVKLAQEQASFVPARAQAAGWSTRSEAALSLSKHAAHHRDKNSGWLTRLRNFVFPWKSKRRLFATRA